MKAAQLMAGYSTYTSAEALAMDADNSALAITPTTTSSPACISAASGIIVTSIDNTFDHGC